jgi:dCMP deaminase
MSVKKIEKHVHYLMQCFVVAMRSCDTSTKHGAVIVSKEGRVLSTGYNGPIRNSVDSEIPSERPEKYYHMIHAEENAILAYNGSYQDIEGSTIYVSGKPCHKCLRMIIQKGIKNIIYPKFPLAKCQDEDDIKATELMLKHHPEVIVKEIDCIDKVRRNIQATDFYIINKLEEFENE